MMTKDKLLRLSSLSLRDLLFIGTEAGVEDDAADETDDLRECLDAILSEPAPTTSTSQPARTTADCLLDSSQPLSTLVLLKDYFKSATVTWQSNLRADAAKTLYYAVIAAAIVYHGDIITNLDMTELDDALQYFVGSAWMPVNLAELFHHAVQKTRGDDLSGAPTGVTD